MNDNTDNRLNELRKKRSELYTNYVEENNKIQEEIDHLEMEKYGAVNLEGKYFRCIDSYDTIFYVYVTEVKRQYAGPSLRGNFLRFDSDSCEYRIDDEYDSYLWFNFNDYMTEISKEEYMEQIDKVCKMLKD